MRIKRLTRLDEAQLPRDAPPTVHGGTFELSSANAFKIDLVSGDTVYGNLSGVLNFEQVTGGVIGAF